MRYLLIILCLLGMPLGAVSKKKSYQAWAKQQTDLVVFSYNRPLQLYAFLESLEKYVTHLHNIHVIYRTTDANFDKGYKEVFKRFAYVRPHKQGKKAPKDFKPLVKKCVYDKKSICPFIMFAVDDIIMTDYVDITNCTKAMNNYKSWFFSLRLGKNITETMLNHVSTMERLHVGIPQGKVVGKEFFSWRFDDPQAQGSWNYPNSVDVTIYRKKDLKRVLYKADYHNPNILEGEWHWHYGPKRSKGLCFTHSKAINIPLNVVNPFWTSANLNISAWSLLDRFLKGYKIDIAKFNKIDNPAPHMDYEPTFIKRKPVKEDSFYIDSE